MVHAELKWLSWDEVTALAEFVPVDPRNVSVRLVAGIGSEHGEGADLFYIHVCTPRWLAEQCESAQVDVGAGKLIVAEYDYPQVHRFIAEYVSNCSGRTWLEAALRVSRLGKWEFDGEAFQVVDFAEWVRRADVMIRARAGEVWRDCIIPLRLESGRQGTTKERSAHWSGAFGFLLVRQRGDLVEVRQSSQDGVFRCADRGLAIQEVGWFVDESLDFLRGLRPHPKS